MGIPFPRGIPFPCTPLLQRGEGATNRSGTAKIGDFRIKQRHFSDILRYVWPFIIIMKALNGFLRYKYK